jgi:hypothetical protein
MLSLSVPAHVRAALALYAFAQLLGCEAQASDAYRGEPLLVMRGSVALERASTEGELRPALAFLNSERAEIEIVEVESEGMFPAQFTLRVYQPPPEHAFGPISGDEGAPRVALAFITAVTAAHPDNIQFAAETVTSIGVTQCSPEPCECPAEGCLRTRNELCTDDGERCFSETVRCPASDSPDEDCTVEQTGDDSLTESPWRSFAGLSENYALFYLEEALEAETPFAIRLGTRDALTAGYNLLSIRALTTQEAADNEACRALAQEHAVERFNETHGTEYSYLELQGVACFMGNDCPEPASEAQVRELVQLIDVLAAEEACLSTPYVAESIDDTLNEAIAVRIGAALDPLTRVELGDDSRMSLPESQ